MRATSSIKPQDILVILKILTLKERPWRQMDLGLQLGLSQAEINLSLERLRRSGLIDETKKKPARLAVIEFLVHGLKYVFPAELGPVSRGIPTAHSFGKLNQTLVSDEFNQFVWPDSEGNVRGISVSPLYESVPKTVKEDPEIHLLLALIDSIRIGRPREKNLAIQEIKERLSNPIQTNLNKEAR